VIKFSIQIGIPGYLDAEDELSNLLQGEGEEESFKYAVEEAIRTWVVFWMYDLQPGKIRVRIEQE